MVDDDSEFRALASAYLQKWGYVVSVTGGIADARALLATVAYDLILCDVYLGSEKGEDLLEYVTTRGSKSAVVMITAKKDLVSTVRMISKGAADFITKPVDWPRLQETLIRHMRSRRNDSPAPTAPVAAKRATKVLPSVLVVEDSSTQRAMWRLNLGQNEAQAIMVGNGSEAIRAIETDGGSLRVLVTDIELGDVTGWVVAETARKRYGDLPVVVISSTVNTGSRPPKELPGDSSSVYCFHKGDRSLALLLVRRLLDLPVEPSRQITGAFN